MPITNSLSGHNVLHKRTHEEGSHQAKQKYGKRVYRIRRSTVLKISDSWSFLSQLLLDLSQRSFFLDLLAGICRKNWGRFWGQGVFVGRQVYTLSGVWVVGFELYFYFLGLHLFELDKLTASGCHFRRCYCKFVSLRLRALYFAGSVCWAKLYFLLYGLHIFNFSLFLFSFFFDFQRRSHNSWPEFSYFRPHLNLRSSLISIDWHHQSKNFFFAVSYHFWVFILDVLCMGKGVVKLQFKLGCCWRFVCESDGNLTDRVGKDEIVGCL